MRITGGGAKGRKLHSPRSNLIRPTSDQVREAMFSLIGERVVNSRVLDLFAGTGALGIEALSRGAASAVFVDKSIETGRLIETNLKSFTSHPRAAFVLLNLATVSHLGRLNTYGSSRNFNLVFMDPPYQKQLAQRVLVMLEKADILEKGALIVVEEHRQADLSAVNLKTLSPIDKRLYGETGLWFYEFRSSTEHCHA
ncbi:MAG: 16S rRNA (guanine(966)-N(2))-methyltransferase RsmD [Desulfobulbus sp.]|nr:16S rRNA (guanine(966)-N(2))-methyltransferase RsmD [Desulfobulbus sp.]